MKVAIEHNIPGVDAAMRQAPDLLMEHVDRFLRQGALEVAREARNRTPMAFSTLRQSISRRKQGPADYLVSAGADYAAYVEEGRKPGGKPPPRWMIEAWINVGKKIQPHNPDMSSRDLAYVISRSIAKKGTEPHPFMAPALTEKTDRLTELVRQGIREGLNAVAASGPVRRQP
ncbi:MAG: HK97 gp10 family phage protein [Magnetococcales bacterium]|nr:HK97 gp10 family phage protein [Magnetococcales bacterium]